VTTNNNDLLQWLWDLYESNDGDMTVDCWQECPRTAVRVILRHINYPLIQTFGFIRMRPASCDEWDAEKGKNLAIHKALAKIAKKINEMPLSEKIENRESIQL